MQFPSVLKHVLLKWTFKWYNIINIVKRLTVKAGTASTRKQSNVITNKKHMIQREIT